MNSVGTVDRPRIFLRVRPESELPRGEGTESFIHRQNITRYRSLLEAGSLDGAQRRSIERLLSEEEGKRKPDQA